MPLSRRHSRKSPIIICAVCTLLVGLLYYLGFPPLHNAEFYTEDYFLLSHYAKRAPLSDQIIFLAIDDKSIRLDQLDPAVVDASPELTIMKNGYPWARTIYPAILDRLFKSGAKVVAMDMLFPTQRDGDDEFRTVLDKYHDRIVIGMNFVESKGTKAMQIPSSDLIPTLDDRVGYVNFWSDKDGVIRSARYSTTETEVFNDPPEKDEAVYFSLAARALQKSGHGDLVHPGESLRIRFAGEPGTFAPHSICDIFVPASWDSPTFDSGRVFKDKIVLIGASGNFLKDEVLSPYKIMPGPEMHLNSINAALSQSYLHDTPEFARYLLIAAAGILAWLMCTLFTAPVLRLLIILLTCVVWLVFAQLIYNFAALCLFAFPPMVALFSGGVVCLSWDFFMEQKEKARMRGKFERYVSKQVVKEIVDNPQSYFNTLGGMRKPVAIFFSDLRGFTALTEKADEHALVTQLNEYFDAMVGPVLENHGCLDKLIGDAIMAVWGNINSHGPAGDVRNAVMAALQMRARLPVINEQWIAAGKSALGMGMGINHGNAIVGDLGSKQQMNFTVIGDAVNLASRIEGTTKEYGVDLLIGEDAADLVHEYFLMQTAGLTQVKGRKKPVELFYVIGERPKEIEPRQVEYLSAYGEGMALYIKGDFAAAGEKFKRSLELHPPDALAKVYIERCAILAKEPVPKDWNGVFVMKGK